MHMAVTLGLMPTTGLTLPFVSATAARAWWSRCWGWGFCSVSGGCGASRRRGCGASLSGQPMGHPKLGAVQDAGTRRLVADRWCSSPAAAPVGHLMPALAIATELRAATPRSRAGAGRCRARHRGRAPPQPRLPLSPAAGRADLPPPMVEERPLAVRGRRGCSGDSASSSTRDGRSAVLGTGGYASAPLGLVRRAARHPHRDPGTERLSRAGHAAGSSRRVRHVYLGLAGGPRLGCGSAHGPRSSIPAIPIRPPDPSARRRGALAVRRRGGDRPVLLVTGGSQGALAINEVVAGWLDGGGAAGAAPYCGPPAEAPTTDSRSYHRPPAVQVFDFLDPIADAYAVADLVVARAGMMTGAELCAWGLPSVLIPLPTRGGGSSDATTPRRWPRPGPPR